VDQETIRKIAEEIARHSSFPWVFLVAQVLLVVVAAGLGAFFGEYLRTRGKNFATRADFKLLQSQLSANTTLVETIKADISQKDWATREWRNLRRVKLEELLKKVSECEAYRDRRQNQAMFAKGLVEMHEPGEPDRGAELRSLAGLYFPELERLVGTYLTSYDSFWIASSKLVLERSAAGKDYAKSDKAFADFRAEFEAQTPKIVQARHAIDAAARKLMAQIMDVSEND